MQIWIFNLLNVIILLFMVSMLLYAALYSANTHSKIKYIILTSVRTVTNLTEIDLYLFCNFVFVSIDFNFVFMKDEV